MKIRSMAVSAITLSLASLACADTFVVDPNGGGDYLSVVSAAQWAPEGSTVLVTAGRYEGAVLLDNRSLTIQAMEGAQVKLVPAFGGLAVPVVTITNTSDVTLRGLTIEEGVHGGVSISNASAVLDGCSISNTGRSCVHIDRACELVQILECDIGPNAGAGVAISNQASGVTQITGGRIHGNEWGNEGGGIYCQGGFNDCRLHVEETEISNNFSSRGGGIHVGSRMNFVTITNCVLEDNRAIYGGGLYIKQENGNSGVKVDGTQLARNNADLGGGGVYVELTHDGTVKFTDCHIVANTSHFFGAGICVRWCDDGFNLLLKQCEVLNNIAQEDGGGLHVDSVAIPQAYDSLFCGNFPVPIHGPWENHGSLVVDTCESGACCLGDACVQMSWAKCEESDGRWGGVGIDCGKISCNGPIEGGCCFGTWCAVLMPEDCELHDGIFLGSSTFCVDSPTYCPKYSKADFDRNNKVDVDDLMKFFDYWGK